MEMFLIFSWEIKIIRQLNFRSPLIQKASSVLKSNGEEPHKVFKVRIFPFSGGPEGCWPTIDRVSRQMSRGVEEMCELLPSLGSHCQTLPNPIMWSTEVTWGKVWMGVETPENGS